MARDSLTVAQAGTPATNRHNTPNSLNGTILLISFAHAFTHAAIDLRMFRTALKAGFNLELPLYWPAIIPTLFILELGTWAVEYAEADEWWNKVKKTPDEQSGVSLYSNKGCGETISLVFKKSTEAIRKHFMICVLIVGAAIGHSIINAVSMEKEFKPQDASWFYLIITATCITSAIQSIGVEGHETWEHLSTHETSEDSDVPAHEHAKLTAVFHQNKRLFTLFTMTSVIYSILTYHDTANLSDNMTAKVFGIVLAFFSVIQDICLFIPESIEALKGKKFRAYDDPRVIFFSAIFAVIGAIFAGSILYGNLILFQENIIDEKEMHWPLQIGYSIPFVLRAMQTYCLRFSCLVKFFNILFNINTGQELESLDPSSTTSTATSSPFTISLAALAKGFIATSLSILIDYGLQDFIGKSINDHPITNALLLSSITAIFSVIIFQVSHDNFMSQSDGPEVSSEPKDSKKQVCALVTALLSSLFSSTGMYLFLHYGLGCDDDMMLSLANASTAAITAGGIRYWLYPKDDTQTTSNTYCMP